MSKKHLGKLLNPESIAVIGAGTKQGSIGAAIMENLISGQFLGEVYPINPNHDKIMGRRCYPDIPSIKKPVHMAVIATPIQTVPDIIDQCGHAGIGGVVIISAGGKEIGEAGHEIEKEIMERAVHYDLRIIGPNCLGIMNTARQINATFAHQTPLPGKIAFLSQSGAVCTTVLDMSIRENVGFSHVVSLGSMMDVDFADMIDYLGGLPTVKSIVMYVESLTHIRKFMSAARSVSRIKPIIALKAGRSTAGAKAAASHTGALAGEDSVYDAAFKRAGILRVTEFQELFDAAEFLAKQKPPKGSKLAIVTNSGGPGVMAADALAAHGLEPAILSPQTMEKLNAVLPGNWSHGNPVDILGDAKPDRYIKAVNICMEAPEVDGLLLLCAPASIISLSDLAQSLADVLPYAPCPVFTAWPGGVVVDPAIEILNKAGIITFDTPERAVQTFVNLYQYGRNIEALQEIPIRKDKRLRIDRKTAAEIIESTELSVLTEIESKALLASYGIPVVPTELATTKTDAMTLARSMGFPVAMKIASRQILHKSDMGGVLLNLKDAKAVETGYQQLMERAALHFPDAVLDGVSVQPMAGSADYELILGARQDRQFGPVILFGMGGVLTEVFRDMATALPPLNQMLSQRLIQKTKISKVIQGYRNIKKIDSEKLEESLIRLSRLVTDFPQIDEMDINPVLVKDGKFLAVDARVILCPTKITAPDHLVISPYPWQYETMDKSIDGEEFFIRPIRPSDASLLIEHFNSLSPRSVYMRFFSPMKQLSQMMLVRLTQIDYDREIALVALTQNGEKEKMVGIARVIFEANGLNGEFSVAIADPWQGKGIGASLLTRCLMYAADKGLEKVWGVVIAENRQMLKLGRKLGFTPKPVPGAAEYRLEIDLVTAREQLNAMMATGKETLKVK